MNNSQSLKLAQQDSSFRKALIQKLSKKKVVLPQDIKDDLVDVVLSAQIDGRQKSIAKYLKLDGLNKKVSIDYIGSESSVAEVRFSYTDEEGEEGEFTLTIDMGKPKFK